MRSSPCPLPRSPARRARALAALALASAAVLAACDSSALPSAPTPTTGGAPVDEHAGHDMGATPGAPGTGVPVGGGVRTPGAVAGGAPLGATGGDVTVPAGEVRTLTGAQTAGILTVEGTLTCDPAGFDLAARVVHVTAGGSFLCGTADAPFTGAGTITMTGERSAETIGGGGTKGIVVDGGVLSLHGAPHAVTWTDGVATAPAGSTTLTLRDAPDWRAGDRVVVTGTTRGTGDDPYSTTEQATVAAVAGNTVTLAEPLREEHPVATESHGGKTIEMVYEVGLLTHNLVFQGDEGSRASEFGGHVMIHHGGQGFVSETEFRRTGQKRVHGRYGMGHWHGLGDGARGQYLRNSSLTEGYYRAGVIHDANGVTFDGNVVDGTFGNAMYLECGSEVDNVLSDNLVGGVRPLLDQDSTTHVQENSPVLDRGNVKIDYLPAAFYSLNPANSWVGNAAHHAEFGYWLNGAQVNPDASNLAGCAAPYEGDTVRRDLAPVLFDDNRAHATIKTSTALDYNVGGSGLYTSNYGNAAEQRFVFSDFTAYDTAGRAVVAEGLVRGGRFANVDSLNHAFGGVIFQDTLLVGVADLPGNRCDCAFRGVQVGENGQGVAMTDTVFAKFPEEGDAAAITFDQGHSNMQFSDDRGRPVPDDTLWIPTFTGNQFVDVAVRVHFPAVRHVRQGEDFDNFVIGEDGTLLGGRSVWMPHATAPAGCAADPANNTLSCPTGGVVVPGNVTEAPAPPDTWYFGTAVAPGGSYTKGDYYDVSSGSVVIGTQAGDTVTLDGRTITFGPEHAVTHHGVATNYVAPVG